MISTHILDISTGSPAAGVRVTLEKRSGQGWSALGQELTNSDGRIVYPCPYEAGVYRLTFEVAAYLSSQGKKPFFLDLPITFEVTDTSRKYHVPLLLSPFGLSTYRGS
ncbi:MAG: hydroxyisourate hydrolase [Verrucomicrobia bacterium]|nr:hydroxyisourate hydrolase [Verrucomicrobiota bacterium]